MAGGQEEIPMTFSQAADLITEKIEPNIEFILRNAQQELFAQTERATLDREQEDCSLLLVAVKANNEVAAEIIIDRTRGSGKGVSWQNSRGTTALHLAVKTRNCTLASLLLCRGAEPSPAMRRDGWTPLHIATSRRNNVKMVKILTDHGADINAQVTNTGWTPLHSAIMEKDQATVLHLVSMGADLALKASKRDVSQGARLTPRELAEVTGFNPLSVFDGVQKGPQGAQEQDTGIREKRDRDGQKMKVHHGDGARDMPEEAGEGRPEGAAKLMTQEQIDAYVAAQVDAQVKQRVEAAMAKREEEERRAEEKRIADIEAKEDDVEVDRRVQEAMAKMIEMEVAKRFEKS